MSHHIDRHFFFRSSSFQRFCFPITNIESFIISTNKFHLISLDHHHHNFFVFAKISNVVVVVVFIRVFTKKKIMLFSWINENKLFHLFFIIVSTIIVYLFGCLLLLLLLTNFIFWSFCWNFLFCFVLFLQLFKYRKHNNGLQKTNSINQLINNPNFFRLIFSFSQEKKIF